VTEVFDYGADRGSTPFDPPPRYERLRNECPVSQVSMWDGSKAWLITRQADVRAALTDERISANNLRPGFPEVSPGAERFTQDTPTFVRMDPPEHTRLRGMINAEFTYKRAVAMRPQIQQIVDTCANDMLAKSPPADLLTEFAQPIPSLVICLILGVPYEDREFFQRHATTFVTQGAGEAAIEAAGHELVRFLGELAESKARKPADDLLSRLVVERERNGELTRDEVVAMAKLLLVAGHETTANSIALSVVALLYHSEQFAALRNDPSLIPGAVDELLRYLTILHTGLPRIAASNTEIGGQQISAGDAVLCYLPSANRDGDWFENPDVFDVRREYRGNVAFGYGVHRCIGAALAKVEMEVALETLIRRFPQLRLAIDFDEIRFRQAMAVYGVHALPVTW
jgi:cytochrome P450